MHFNALENIERKNKEEENYLVGKNLMVNVSSPDAQLYQQRMNRENKRHRKIPTTNPRQIKFRDFNELNCHVRIVSNL